MVGYEHAPEITQDVFVRVASCVPRQARFSPGSTGWR
jgi:hypothetical protein